jgi:DNA-binding response OmpR family regulator
MGSFEMHVFCLSPESKKSATSAREKFTFRNRQNLKILIVEDERLIAENLKYVVEEKGHHVIAIAASGEEAVEKAKLNEPDLILMDIRIKGEVDGVHAAKVIQDIYAKKIPVLFLSAHSQDQYPHLLNLDSASFFYLKKPYTPEDLLAAIDGLLKQS